MNPNQALWEKGDFTRIAATMRESGTALVGQLGIAKGMRVLDVGSGDGTTALPGAELGADVLAVDIARNLVEAGAARAEGMSNLRFRHGDVTDLNGIDDRSFDLVVSIFGAMFAPKPFDVAKELVRVTKPGGRIVMGNWIPNDPTLVAQILKISAAYTPPPPEGYVSPMTWGVESHVIERFAAFTVCFIELGFCREGPTVPTHQLVHRMQTGKRVTRIKQLAFIKRFKIVIYVTARQRCASQYHRHCNPALIHEFEIFFHYQGRFHK